MFLLPSTTCRSCCLFNVRLKDILNFSIKKYLPVLQNSRQPIPVTLSNTNCIIIKLLQNIVIIRLWEGGPSVWLLHLSSTTRNVCIRVYANLYAYNYVLYILDMWGKQMSELHAYTLNGCILYESIEGRRESCKTRCMDSTRFLSMGWTHPNIQCII